MFNEVVRTHKIQILSLWHYELIVYTYITENLIQMIFNEIARYWYKNEKVVIYIFFSDNHLTAIMLLW